MEGSDAASQAETTRRYGLFLNASEKTSRYGQKIDDMMADGTKGVRLIVDLNHLRETQSDLARSLLTNPIEHLPMLEKAVTEAVLNKEPDYLVNLAKNRFAAPSDKQARIFVGFTGPFGAHQVNPRTLTSELLSKLVCVEGIVTKCSSVRPKVAKTVHYCPKTDQFQTREYRDQTDLVGLPTGSVYPTKDDQGNKLETEFGLSAYKDSQTVTIQEMPESAPLGQLPRSVDVYLDHDLVDLVKPGDRVAISGIYRALAGQGGLTNGMFRTMLLGNNISRLGAGITRFVPQGDDIGLIRKLSQDPDVFNIVARSLAPSIFGHKYIKQALTLLLLGGVEHTLANGTHLRGDINVLMVGDPSTAKSQMLRFVLNLAPLAINTTGRGSSGVGLTAAVTTDPETGERRLEAGAMVLADRGVVCIDEFDKMGEGDRVAIHEVMEQQTVTIAKAGIQASLNARCSVVAAANPIYGRFDNTIDMSKNVSLPDSLLSRFDLLFVVRDVIKSEDDNRLAEHVLRMHRYVKPGMEGIPVPLDASAAHQERDDDKAGDDLQTPVWQKYNPLLHGGAAAEAIADGGTGADAAKKGNVQILTLEFLRKYIAYARQSALKTNGPKLTEPARAAIIEAYNQFRQQNQDRNTVVTARSLETIIRLSSAHAKLRLSRYVTAEDVEVVKSIMLFALYADAKVRTDEGGRSAITKADARKALLEKERKEREAAEKGDAPAPGGGGGNDDDDDDDPDNDGAGAGAGAGASSSSASPSGSPGGGKSSSSSSKKTKRGGSSSSSSSGAGAGSASKRLRRGQDAPPATDDDDYDDVIGQKQDDYTEPMSSSSRAHRGEGGDDYDFDAYERQQGGADGDEGEGEDGAGGADDEEELDVEGDDGFTRRKKKTKGKGRASASASTSRARGRASASATTSRKPKRGVGITATIALQDEEALLKAQLEGLGPECELYADGDAAIDEAGGGEAFDAYPGENGGSLAANVKALKAALVRHAVVLHAESAFGLSAAQLQGVLGQEYGLRLCLLALRSALDTLLGGGEIGTYQWDVVSDMLMFTG